VSKASTITPSPMPWTVERTNARGWKGISIVDANGLHIAYMVMQPAGDNEMANAKAIVDAVNASQPQRSLLHD
jgi:hypothetical protein